MAWLNYSESSSLLQVRVKPGSHSDKIAGINDDRLVICLRAKAIEGAANNALIEFLAEHLKVSKRAIILLKGECSPFKVIKIQAHLTEQQFI